MFALAWLGPDGCIRLTEYQTTSWARVFHRGNRLDNPTFRGTITFDTLEEAKLALTDDEEHFIVQFTERGPCERLWFRPEQFDSRIVKRLDRWRGCYGGYPLARLKGAVPCASSAETPTAARTTTAFAASATSR
jgi:hypothetical protein